MINLIPPKAKKIVIREYWSRVAAVWMLMLSFALLIMSLLSLPTYVLIRSLEDAMASQIDYAKAEEGSYKESERVIRDTNAFVNHLRGGEEDIAFSIFIEELDKISSENITLTQFGFARENGELKQISLTGHANTRVGLSNFRDELAAHELFASVDLPISNLAKDKDITFSMKLLLEERMEKP